MLNMGLVKAALYKPERFDGHIPRLPENAIEKEVHINSTHCERYNKAVGWKLGIASVIHPNYLQVLTLPMQLQMMNTKPFPFKPMGLVHLANHIDVKYLPEQSAKLMLKTSFKGLSWHKKGWVFAVLSEGFVDGELAISGTSYYLSRQKHNKTHDELIDLGLDSVLSASMPEVEPLEEPFDKPISMQFPVGLGRKYARVSGDFNPIHLSSWSAKLMGFKEAIAHGMYSKAWCLSLILKQEMQLHKKQLVDTPMQFSTQFMQAIYLPTRCDLVSQREENQIHFSLVSTNRSKVREHLRTNVNIT